MDSGQDYMWECVSYRRTNQGSLRTDYLQDKKVGAHCIYFFHFLGTKRPPPPDLNTWWTVVNLICENMSHIGEQIGIHWGQITCKIKKFWLIAFILSGSLHVLYITQLFPENLVDYFSKYQIHCNYAFLCLSWGNKFCIVIHNLPTIKKHIFVHI
jgi:hypothetical protein